MMKVFGLTFLLSISLFGYSQRQTENNFSLNLSVGNFIVGHEYITGIWTGVDAAKTVPLHSRTLLHKLTIGGEVYFENGADKATVYDPTPSQFIEAQYYHESNTGFTAKISYYPFGGFMKGFHIAAGPLLVYSIRTYEKRAQLIQYSPDLSIRMSELGSDNKLLGGYRITTGYDIYFQKHWLAGVRADFLQYHERDLNSLLALKAGYRF